MGLTNGTKISSLQFESNYKSIRCYFNFILCKTLIKFLHLPKFHISSKLIRENWHYLQTISWLTLPHKSPFLIRAIKASKIFGININQFPQYIKYIKPPWLNTKSIIEPIFTKISLEKPNSLTINYIVRELKASRYLDFIMIFTEANL